MEEKSLVRLVRRNWVNIWSIKSIIKNISDIRGELQTFQFGKDGAQDEAYIKKIRGALGGDLLDRLGINQISNAALLKELKILNKGIVEGSPRVEIIQSCESSSDESPKNCPPAKVKEIVKEVYVETCEGNKTGIVQQCGIDQCLDVAKDYCDEMMASAGRLRG